MKELKIRYRYTDAGFCREVWDTEVITEKSVPIGRDTMDSDRSWWILTPEWEEPLSRVGKDITLIICDENWNEIGRDGNDLDKFPNRYPLIEPE